MDKETIAEDVSQPGETLVGSTQAALDCWTGTLGTTGGATNIDKTYWTMVDFRWDIRDGHFGCVP